MVEKGDLAPDRTARSKCWAARDMYFACLDAHELWLDGLKPGSYEEIVAIDPANPPMTKKPTSSSWFGGSNQKTPAKNDLFTCRKALEAFQSDCLPSWVSHGGSRSCVNTRRCVKIIMPSLTTNN